jgi:hypothetical protein
MIKKAPSPRGDLLVELISIDSEECLASLRPMDRCNWRNASLSIGILGSWNMRVPPRGSPSVGTGLREDTGGEV